MATSIIDGTIEEAHLKRSFWNMRVFDPVLIRQADGHVENLGKTIVEGHLAYHIVPGAAGRFYRYTAIDHRGIHGVRLTNGEEAYGFARNNEIASIACILMGAALVAIYLLTGTVLSSWMWLLLVIGLVGLPLYGSARAAAWKQYCEDQGYIPPAPAEAAPV
jgi:hypothetical protein